MPDWRRSKTSLRTWKTGSGGWHRRSAAASFFTLDKRARLRQKAALSRLVGRSLRAARPPARRHRTSPAMATTRHTPTVSIHARRVLPNPWDGVAFVLILALFALAGYGAQQMNVPLSGATTSPLSLDPSRLPDYALRTTLRMILALLASLVFTFVYATLAAKLRRAELLLVPLLDILQSVPILGFVSVTVVAFMALVPGRLVGSERAPIFPIFTSQAWNMAFSFYQGLRTLPKDLDEASRSLRLSAWLRFWRVEVPFAMPGLVWNMMMSMSGGWFFVVAAEAISVGNTTIQLPGIGSYIALAIEKQDLTAIGWAVLAMLA